MRRKFVTKFVSKVYKSGNKLYIYVPKNFEKLLIPRREYIITVEEFEE